MWTGSLEQYLARKELAKLSFPEGRILLLPDIKAIVPTLLLVPKLSASYLVFTHYFQLLWFSKCIPPILILGKLTLCLKHMKFFKHQTATQSSLTFVDLKQSIEKLWNSDNVKENRISLCLLTSPTAKKMSLDHTTVEIQYTVTCFLHRLCHKKLWMFGHWAVPWQQRITIHLQHQLCLDISQSNSSILET